jgi:hypothetical protein
MVLDHGLNLKNDTVVMCVPFSLSLSLSASFL